MSWRSITAIIVVLVAAGVSYVLFTNRLWTTSNELKLPGVVEIQEVRLGSKVGGRIAEVLVKEGQYAEPGELLVRFAVPELLAQKEQQVGRVSAAEAELMKARNGWRKEEVDQARSDLETNEADLKQAEEDFARVEPLYKEGTLARGDFDAARATRDRAKGRVASSRFHYQMMQAGTRPEDISLAEANVIEAKGKLDEINANLEEANVVAPEKSLIEVVAVRKGDLVAPNTPVVRVLRAADVWIRVYVPETLLGKVRLNQSVTATADAFPGRKFPAVVFQISNEAEFTPRNVQSLEERHYQVFGIKIRVDDPDGVFKAGMAAQVQFQEENH